MWTWRIVFFQYENFSIIFNVTHLVEKSRCTILLSQIADLLDGSNTATHKVNVLKSDDLVRFLRILFEFSLQIQELEMTHLAPGWRMLWIMEAWFMASENKIQEGISALRVDRVAHRIVSSMTGLLPMSRWSLARHTCTWFAMWATEGFPQVGSWCWNDEWTCPDASCQALLCRKPHSWSWCVFRPQWRFSGEKGSHLQEPSPLDVLSGSCSG